MSRRVPWVYTETIRRVRVHGDGLRRARMAKGLSLREAARRIGISAPFLLDLEADRRQPSPPVLARVVRVLA